MSGAGDPPFYILVSHSSALTGAAPSSAIALSHPIIEYHYADDSPQSLLPQHPDEHILLIDHDAVGPSALKVQSLSSGLAVTGLKVTDAPGAGIAEEEVARNEKMYIVETTTLPEAREEDEDVTSPQAVLTRFRQRNLVLRQVLDHPGPSDEVKLPIVPMPDTPPVDLASDGVKV